jgi:hypothetical protein
MGQQEGLLGIQIVRSTVPLVVAPKMCFLLGFAVGSTGRRPYTFWPFGMIEADINICIHNSKEGVQCQMNKVSPSPCLKYSTVV